MNKHYIGFTLIELVVTIVLLSIGLLGLLTLILNTTQHTVDPMIQQQAYAIAQSQLEEVLAQPFCDPDSANCPASCSSCGDCNSVEASRDQFDSVCDYDASSLVDGTVRDFSGNPVSGLGDYNVSVTVQDSGTRLGLTGGSQILEVDVNVTHKTSPDLDVTLKAYKTNTDE